jgi:glycosyltransferase involved in cell wall biosynthesis
LFKIAITEHGENWDFAWIHFGTTAPVVGPYLMENNIPFFIQVHGYDVTMKFADSEYKSEFVRWANLSMGVICSSNHIRRICILAGVRENNVFVIGNALNVSSLLQIQSKKTEHPSFVHFGRLTGKKHPLATLHAFILVQREIPDAQITFIGRGGQKALQSVAQTYGIDHLVTFTGPMPQELALPLVASHWVFCQHSVTDIRGDQEGFANSPAEASLLGIPVVSTFHNGIPEHVLHEKTGFLVKEFDYEEMARYMIELAKSPELRASMGANGRRNISSLCDPSKRAKAVKELVRSRLYSSSR